MMNIQTVKYGFEIIFRQKTRFVRGFSCSFLVFFSKLLIHSLLRNVQQKKRNQAAVNEFIGICVSNKSGERPILWPRRLKWFTITFSIWRRIVWIGGANFHINRNSSIARWKRNKKQTLIDKRIQMMTS